MVLKNVGGGSMTKTNLKQKAQVSMATLTGATTHQGPLH